MTRSNTCMMCDEPILDNEIRNMDSKYETFLYMDEGKYNTCPSCIKYEYDEYALDFCTNYHHPHSSHHSGTGSCLQMNEDFTVPCKCHWSLADHKKICRKLRGVHLAT
jgi:hypothetical protein